MSRLLRKVRRFFNFKRRRNLRVAGSPFLLWIGPGSSLTLSWPGGYGFWAHRSEARYAIQRRRTFLKTGEDIGLKVQTQGDEE